MSVYTDYTIELSMQSAVITPFQSDTLFGHICWAIRFLAWETTDKLQQFLAAYDSDTPPLLISNGFRRGYLPKPVLRPIKQDELKTLFDDENRVEESSKIKAIKSIDVIPKYCLGELQTGSITPAALFDVVHQNYQQIDTDLNQIQPMVVQHNTIDRISGTSRKGLYAQPEYFHQGDGGKFEIYLKTNYFTHAELERLFEFIKEQGFGRDKSTGKGHFDFNIEQGCDLPETESPNAFMTLSSYIPTSADPVQGFYNIVLKYGKLGGLYAKGILNGNPFKKPLIMFSAGSTFFDPDFHTEKHYGALLADVHHEPSIRHYAYAFPLGVNLACEDL